MKEARNTIMQRKLTVRATEALVRNIKENRVVKPQKKPDPQQVDLIELLQRHFKTRIAIRQSTGGGKIEISFKDQKELTRLIELINL
jgi:ParB family chromosome partitioning protein